MNLNYATYRLEVWGDWARENVARGLGYPSRSVEQKAREGRGGGMSPSENPECEELDRLVLELGPTLREVVIYSYARGWSVSKIARQTRASRNKVGAQLQQAVAYIAGRLAD